VVLAIVPNIMVFMKEERSVPKAVLKLQIFRWCGIYAMGKGSGKIAIM
jgi:hypothetical protein